MGGCENLELTALAEIRTVEEQAQGQILASEKEAREMINKAKAQAQKLVAQSREDAKKQGEQLVARLIGETEAQIAQDDAQNPLETIEQEASMRLPQAVEHITSAIKERERWR